MPIKETIVCSVCETYVGSPSSMDSPMFNLGDGRTADLCDKHMAEFIRSGLNNKEGYCASFTRMLKEFIANEQAKRDQAA